MKNGNIISSIVFLFLVLFFIQLKVSGQVKTSIISAEENSVNVKMSFSDRVTLKDTNGVKYISFPNSLNESNPGSPELPSKIVFIAIPPMSKVTISMNNQQYSTYQNVNIEANPKVSKLNDTTLSYENQNLRKEFFHADQYPVSEYQIVGYTWIRDYYCAIIKINSASTYNWKLKQVKLLNGSNLNIEL